MTELLRYELGDTMLQSGRMLMGAFISYVTHGTLDLRRGNAILFPTHYLGTHRENEWLIGPGKALDTERYFVIVPNMFTNGVSSSPSNMPAPQHGPHFPQVTILDNVVQQHRLVHEKLGIEYLQLVVGFSMGALQSYQWATSYPEMVKRVIPIAGSARTSPHNKVFLEGVTAALKADSAWQDGHYQTQPEKGMRAMGRVWAGWGLSQAFYRRHAYRSLGYDDIESYIVAQWENDFAAADANDLLAMARTWSDADIGATPGFDGDFERALASIRARTLIMPGATDLYFPVEDSEYEAAYIPGAVLKPIPSIWGHAAGGGSTSEDAAFVSAQVRAWLEQ